MTKPYRDWRRAGSFADMSADEVRRRSAIREKSARRVGHGSRLKTTIVHDGLSPDHLEALERLAQSEGAILITMDEWTRWGTYGARGLARRQV